MAALVLLVAANSAVALDATVKTSQLVHQYWGHADGLPAGALWVVHYAANGFLWIGAEGGLVRFDGVNFTQYNSTNHPALAVNDIRSIAESADGTLWLATYGGGVVRVSGSTLTRFDARHGLNDNVVYSVLVASDGTVWAGTARGLCRLHQEEIFRFECWSDTEGLAQGRVGRLAEDDNGVLWVTNMAAGVSSFDGKRFRLYTAADGMASQTVFNIYNDPALGIIFGTYAGEFHRVVDGELQNLDTNELPAGLVPLSMQRDREGNLWAGMNADAGIWQLRPNVRRLDNPIDDIAYVFDMDIDEEGALWVTTTNGLHRYHSAPFVPWGEAEGLADSTFVVASAPDGGVWAGTEGAGLFRLHADGDIRQFGIADGLPSETILSLLVEPDGTVWTGTFDSGIYRLRNGGIEKLLDRADGLPANLVASLIRDRNGALWAGTGGGLARIVDGEVTHVLTSADGLAVELTRHLSLDKDGNILASSDSGLSRISVDSMTVMANLSPDDGLASPIVASTYTDSDGIIWIGSRGTGLARLDGDSLFQFDQSHGLGIESVMTIVEDDDQHLWLAGRRGVARISRAELNAVATGESTQVSSRTYAEEDGLRTTIVPGGYQQAAARAVDGRVWMATTKGLAVVNPAALPARDAQLTPQIDALRIDGVAVPLQSTIEIPAGTSAIEIDYTVPRINDGDELEFRYRLQADGDRWQAAANRRTAFFNSLSPRRNVFEVEVTRRGESFGAGNPYSSSLELFVQPHWYQTYAAQVSALIGFLLLAILSYRFALAGYKHRETNLEKLVDERTRALVEALSEVRRMSQTDVLTGVANRRHFEERLGEEWERSVRERIPISVMMIDIDYFKQFNDVAGHQAGDQCLRDVANALSASLRDQDFMARYGGEEFAVLLTDSDAHGMALIGARLQESVGALNIPHPGRPPGTVVTVSAGFATAKPGVIDTAEELIRRADDALYTAKERGRDCLVLFKEKAANS
ncbi:MAG: diguanylate cyclase [Pseudomonadota bacterium]